MISQKGSELGKSSSLSHIDDGSGLLSFAPTQPLTFTMLTIGSRGDVQPYIALAKGLQADGHRVRIATHAEFGDWIIGHGIDFSEIGGDPAELMRICVENGTFTVSFLREGVIRFRDWLDDLLASAWRACQRFSCSRCWFHRTTQDRSKMSHLSSHQSKRALRTENGCGGTKW